MARNNGSPPAVGTPSIAVVRLREMKARIEQAITKGSLTAQESDTLDFSLERTLRDALGENHGNIYQIINTGGSVVIDVDEPEAKRGRQAF